MRDWERLERSKTRRVRCNTILSTKIKGKLLQYSAMQSSPVWVDAPLCHCGGWPSARQTRLRQRGTGCTCGRGSDRGAGARAFCQMRGTHRHPAARVQVKIRVRNGADPRATPHLTLEQPTAFLNSCGSKLRTSSKKRIPRTETRAVKKGASPVPILARTPTVAEL